METGRVSARVRNRFGEDAFMARHAENEDTIDCPCCGKQIHEESERCPHCENYLSEEDARPGRKPWWIVVCALLCLYAVYRWISGG
jgi:hypothetical protein